MRLPRPLRAAPFLALLVALAFPLALAALAQDAPPAPNAEAYAEAMQQANVRVRPGTESEMIWRVHPWRR